VAEFKRVILIIGTPGVGKTVVSKLLASKIDVVYINLAELVKRERLILGVDKARDTLIADIDNVSKRIREILESSERDVVIDGHYAMDVVSAKDVHLAFVLRRSPDELKKTLETRGFREKKLWENLAAEVLDVCLWDAISACDSEKVCEIDVSDKKVADVVKEILSILNGEEKCRVRIVDWLGKLEAENRLHDFLKNF
jgi:adenylate kinase